MSVVTHVHGPTREPLPPFGGHLVRNLEWGRFSPDALDSDATLVLSPDTPSAGELLLEELRAAGLDDVVVVLTDDALDWEPLGRLADVHVMNDRSDLLTLLGSGSPEGVSWPPNTDDEQPPHGDAGHPLRQVPRGGTRNLLRERLGTSTPGLQPSVRDFGHELFARSHIEETETAPAPVIPAPAEGSPLETVASPTTGLEPSRANRGTRGRRRLSPAGRELRDPDVLVPALLGVADRLYGVRETGAAVVGHVKEVVGVDAVAILVPDGAVWAVAAAMGHRHLEERLVLTKDHWLVAEVTSGHHGLVVEDTDIVRTRLAGAPLAAWPHLMACPVGPSGAVVLMARGAGGPPFTSRDLGQASHALVEADDLLSAAMTVRQLARRLLSLADLDHP